ncbi:MAG: hypothetical protein M1839_003262 [Geoglossum umbratile]|nr:MAG: hypothetical protein M1839_003262 [Geoglossum umbratile]
MSTCSATDVSPESAPPQPQNQPHDFIPAMEQPPASQCTYKLDEGYSEETRSQAGSDAALRTDASAPNSTAQRELFASKLPHWIRNLPDADRSELAHTILRSLRTSEISTIVERLRPLLHIDPVSYLPPELAFHIFSYLPPQPLLKASMTSHVWRERVLDPRLWKQLYRSQGWGIEAQEVARFQDELRGTYALKLGDRRSKLRRADVEEEDHQLKHKVRSRTGVSLGSVNGRVAREGPRGWSQQHDTVEADENTTMMSDATASVNDNDEMQDVNYHTSAPSSQSPPAVPSLFNNNNNATSFNSVSADEDEMYPSPPASSRESAPRSSFASIIAAGGVYLDPLQVRPSLITPLTFGIPRMNWHHLYKQRKKLEDNWDKGRYVNFQLPHPDHNDEAHSECIYTVQYSRNYLVSGSRDRTLRIWDLKTRRLFRKPLEGHTASVLCLQFDESREEDVIISGSSDTSVIIWKFSTGEVIKKMEKAHKESVLNLRFDKRFLVTCSKDRTIKVWSRTTLSPGDPNYPEDPVHSTHMTGYPTVATQPRAPKKQGPVPPYTHLKTLTGHSAAVNAIQLYGDEIVSASGDRTIKVWSIANGNCIQTVQGHTKGIACIQFDGRRIVSGSSDNTVRIFDKVTGAEVACLAGHANLVRTVQAGFGDLPGGEEEDEEEARETDRQFFITKLLEEEEGTFLQSHRLGRRPRNAGSKNPHDIMAFGAKLPPGGGGSRFGRIVSGSYDETIIIWRRDNEGKWVVSHRLRQDTALRAAESAAQQAPRQPAQHQALANTNVNPIPAGAQNAHAYLAQQQAGPFQPPPAHPAMAAQQPQPHHQGPQNPPHTFQQAQAAANAHNLQFATHQQAQQQAQQQAHQQAIANNPVGIHGGNGRVFKLQFDARMIICCSQDPRIVGWDFANGDEKIIEASRFFQGC